MSTELTTIFSRKLKLGGIAGSPVTREIKATPEERAALATLFAIPAIAALSGQFTITHLRGGVLAVHITLYATLTRICVVSLEPFEMKVTESAPLRLVPARSLGEAAALSDAQDLEGPDEIPYAGDVIDLGGLLAEQLALAIEPYPRRPGAILPGGLA